MEPPDYTFVPTPEEYERRIASERALPLGQDRISPRTAALYRRFGRYVDTADVEGEDTNLLHPDDARWLRDECGMRVDPADVEGGIF